MTKEEKLALLKQKVKNAKTSITVGTVSIYGVHKKTKL